MADKIGVVILAAGEGTRMKMELPKPLVPLSGRRLIDYPVKLVESFKNVSGTDVELSIVTGHGSEKVEAHLNEKFSELPITYAFQEKRKGTADALRTYFDKIADSKERDYTLIMCADTPLIDKETLLSLYRALKGENIDAVCASFHTQNPHGYGRIERTGQSFSIIEEKDAGPEQKQIQEVNSGLYMMKTSYILKHLNQIDDQNASGEFYLTDLFSPQRNVKALAFQDAKTFQGVNDLDQLETVENEVRRRKIQSLMRKGVRFMDRRHCYIEDTVEVAEGSTLHPNIYLYGRTKIEEGVTIEPGAIVKDSIIHQGAQVLAYSHLEKSRVGEEACVGPYARLREGTHLEAKVKVGNFVETKKAHLETGAKVSHLSYVGDAEIGSETNIGCGFITCNFDGRDKHVTKIGKNSFVGSDCQTVAPVEIGDECFVASGSTINQSLKDGDFAISRCRQTTREGMAKRFLKKKE